MTLEQVRAGAAVVDITPGAGVAMGGYGARKGVSAGTHDALTARTLVLDDGDTKVVLSYCDLVGVGPDIVGEARELVAAECGVPPDHVLIGATHTHSGPGNVRASDSSGYASQVARKVAGSVHEALGRLVPVSLKLADAPVTQVSQNRRHPDGPIEAVARVLLAAPEGNAPAVATVVNYACHSTVLEYDNMLYSGDWPGASNRFLERNLGGVGIYMQGCAGDINPVWMRHDFAEVERIGGIVGAAAVKAAHEMRPLGEGQWAVNLSWSEQTPKASAPGTVLTGIGLAGVSRTVDVPRRVLPPADELDARIAGVQAQLAALRDDDVDGRRALRPQLNMLRMMRVRGYGARHPGQTETLEVCAVRLSAECAIVTLPGEFHVEIGDDIRAATAMPGLLVSGYTNGYAGYVPKAKDFPEGGYEVGSARFEPEAADMLTRTAVDAVRAVCEPARV